MFEAIFLYFLPEFNTGVVGGGGRCSSGDGFFLRLSKNENKNGAGDGVDGVIFLSDTNMGIGRVLNKII